MRQQALVRLRGVGLRLIGDCRRRRCDGIDGREIQRRRAGKRRRGQFERLGLGRQRRAIGVGGEDRIGVLAFGQRRERLALLVEGRRAPLIADRGLISAHCHRRIDFQGQRMADAGVGRVALVMIVDGLAGVIEKHRMAVRSSNT